MTDYKIEELQAQIESLQSQKKALEEKEKLLFAPLTFFPRAGQAFVSIDGEIRIESFNIDDAQYYDNTQYEAANQYFRMIEKIHACKGVVRPTEDYQWMFDIYHYEILVRHVSSLSIKLEYPFPVFDTNNNCQAALDSIGADEMLRIIKAFHQVDG